MLLLFRVGILTLFFLGCSVKEPSLAVQQQRALNLEKLLLNLSSTVKHEEANALAKASITYSYELSKKYKAVNSPWLQNTLVNLGIKKRGLCHEWAGDLLNFLVNKHYQTFTFHAVGANIGFLNEHNALSVSAKNRGIEKSILLDAWRNSGILYFNVIEKDKKYHWKERVGLYGVLPPKGGKR